MNEGLLRVVFMKTNLDFHLIDKTYQDGLRSGLGS